MRTYCPKCGILVELQSDSRSSEIKCPSCQVSFPIATEDTLNFDGPRIESRSNAPPATISRFEFLQHLGSGASGGVWKVRDTKRDRIVAVKLAHRNQVDSPAPVQFQREAGIATLLDHPNIVRVHEAGVEGGQEYLASEFVDGIRLDTLSLDRQMSIREAVAICSRIARALHYAHERGVIHRDINPRNIIVDLSGQPHILDFGLAAQAQFPSDDPTGIMHGTPAYMSPEQVRGDDTCDPRVDVYALGVICYELLTGRKPFRGEGRDLFDQILHEDAPSPREVNQSVSHALDKICRKCLAKHPQFRYGSALELADALDRVLANPAISPARPATNDTNYHDDPLQCSPRRDINSLEAEVARLSALTQDLQHELQERTRMFLSTKAEHQLYQSLVESLPLCVYRLDMEGRFVFANEYFCKTQGRVLKELQGAFSSDLYPEPLAKKHREAEAEVIATGHVVEGIEEHASDEGMPTYYEVLRSPIRNFRGEIVGIQGLMWDVSAHRKAENALRDAKEAAESANRAKSEFLANISHEIRTPMNAIIGITDLMLKNRLTEDERKQLEMVLASADALMGIIDEVLDFSKIEAKGLDIRVADFDLNELLDRTISPLSVRARSKGIPLVIDVATAVPRRVAGDGMRMRQVLTNLVGNAIKFTEQGKIEVQVDRVGDVESYGETSLPPEQPGGSIVCLHFAVSDTGVGIPGDKLAVIFEPFTQGDGSITRTYGGTGLGLTIAKRLIELMGGKIWVESEVAVGSVFHFTVNFREASVEAVAGKNRSPQISDNIVSRCTPLSILLVEDHPINQEFGVRAITTAGHKVTLANNGQEALDAISGQSFDVVLMDIQMPVMDGLTATREIRKREAITGERLKIIAVTAHAMRGDYEQCLLAGMDGYISKPLKAHELLRELNDTTISSVDTADVRYGRMNQMAFDREKLLERVGGDKSFLRRTVTMFHEDYPIIQLKISAAFESLDYKSAGTAVHQLKGLIRNFSALAACAALEKLESRLSESDMNTGFEFWGILQREISRLQQELDDFVPL